MKYKLQSSIIVLFSFFCILNILFAKEVNFIVLEQPEINTFNIPDNKDKSDLYFGDSLVNFLAFDPLKNAFKFSDSVNFQNNEIINFRLENLPTAPNCENNDKGRAYHNMVDKYSYVCNGKEWNIIDNDYNSLIPLAPYIESIFPNAVSLNTTNKIEVKGVNFTDKTIFNFDNLAIIDTKVINGSKAIITIESGNTKTDTFLTANTKGIKWPNNEILLKVYEKLDMEEIQDNLNTKGVKILEWIPNLHKISCDGTDGLNGKFIADGGDDMYDNGNFINTNGEKNISYTNGNKVKNEIAFGKNSKYFTSVVHDIFFLVADLNKEVTEFFIDGNLGADGKGSVDYYQFTYQTYTAYIKRVYGSGSDPSVNHVIIVDKNMDIKHEAQLDSKYDFHKISGINTNIELNDNKLYYMLFASKNSGFIDNNNIENIIIYMVENILQ
jgi:hypothetical protein